MSDDAPKEWEYDGPTEITIVLVKPVKLSPRDPNELTEIVLTEPTLDQMITFQDEMNKTGNELRAVRAFIAVNAGVSAAHVGKFVDRDVRKAQAFLTGFTPPPPKAGSS